MTPDDPYLSIISHYQMGRIHHLLGNPELAYHHLLETLRFFRHDKLGWGEGLVLTELGLIAETRGKLDEALGYYTEVLAAVTQWEEVWNYHRTQISIGRVKLALGRVPEAIATFNATLQGLLANPQLGLEIDCFVEIAPILLMDGKPALTIALLEYCAVQPECFQTTRDRAARYLSAVRATSSVVSSAPARALLPSDKRGIAELLMREIRRFQQLTPPPPA